MGRMRILKVMHMIVLMQSISIMSVIILYEPAELAAVSNGEPGGP